MQNKIIDLDFLIKKIKKNSLIQIYNSRENKKFANFLKEYFFKEFKVIKLFNKKIYFDYIKFGNTDIFDTLLISELMIFDFYFRKRKKYKNALDIGANIGLHSIILSKLGINVSSFEPDNKHFLILKKNIAKNKCKNIKTYKLAIWSKKKNLVFNRVINNTTGSHIDNLKENPYGKIIKVSVKSENINKVIEKIDLIKIDCEGSEKVIFKHIDLKKLEKVDCILEISDKSSRKIIWEKLKKSKLKIYSQKIGWMQSKKIFDLPKNYKEGNVFISQKNTFK